MKYNIFRYRLKHNLIPMAFKQRWKSKAQDKIEIMPINKFMFYFTLKKGD